MMQAQRMLAENKVRRLPVVDDVGRVVGIVSDRDIKEALPSKATSLDRHEINYLISELKVREIMTKNPVCARETDSVEGMALVMLDKRFGGMPVVDDERRLCGIITDTDIFKLLASITGVEIGGVQLAFELENKPGTLRPIMDKLASCGARTISILTSQEEKNADKRRVYIRMHRLDKEIEEKLFAELQTSFSLLYIDFGHIPTF